MCLTALLWARFWQPQVRLLGKGRRSFPSAPLAVTVQLLRPQRYTDRAFQTSPKPLFPKTDLRAKSEGREVEEMTAKQGEKETWRLTPHRLCASCGLGERSWSAE